MATSKAKTVSEYLSSLPDDRKKAIGAIRKVIRANLPKGIKEVMNWGMITYEIPLSTYPVTYNKQPLVFAALAAQKNHLALYLNCQPVDPKASKKMIQEFKAAGKKVDIGKSCVRFKKLEDLELKALGQFIAALSVKKVITHYESTRSK